MSRVSGIFVLALAAGLVPTAAPAQVIGTFRWQLAPHCNVVTLTVEQVGAAFRVHGFDDRCGAARRAGVSGTAQQNPDGTIGLSFTVVRPDGLTLATSAAIAFPALDGSWADEYANGGTLVFNPSAAAGTPRGVTIAGFFAMEDMASGAGREMTVGLPFGRTLPSAPLAPQQNIIPVNGAPTAACPGTFGSPKAAPGHLCIYSSFFSNGFNAIFDGLGEPSATERHGAGLVVYSAAAGVVSWFGSWAVTVP